ncbi:hypothetical protein FHS43_003868 [Streptosporangium becharense]|uniref:Uncharacterized protein n=1 Tax=Streptosporangium becharense TaxID=1816182 RepID=A0A7W9MH54_9ACTN|nr:hypothetical protein [Streptosporangium becharense]MBB2912585.1 hypothetical protein [Streptosporangium becharense]MBB5820585.1 hypothetical protein [Streptosporangium becharense]
MIVHFAEEHFPVWASGLVESEQPVSRPTPEAVLFGELHGPDAKRLVQVHERVVQIEEREALPGHHPADRL